MLRKISESEKKEEKEEHQATPKKETASKK
uniref:Uncharacterized protein n=1 Tax=Romanomermis culicivorax TaxID=13658 RepID=A0A915ITH4_ROMCU